MKLSALLSLASAALVLAAPVTNDGAEEVAARDYGNHGAVSISISQLCSTSFVCNSGTLQTVSRCH